MKSSRTSLIFFFILASICPLIFNSCSLDYGQETNAESKVPEFVFRKVKFSRYEDAVKNVQLNAEQLEQYKVDSSAYARDVDFYSWTKDRELDTEGSCHLMGIDTQNNLYILHQDISIRNLSQNFQIEAENLKWNGKTEQLVSSRDETVKITYDNMELEGTGFSASGISKSFSFNRDVKGTLETGDKKTDNAGESSDEKK